jgi:hypothetical protein
VVTHSRSFWRPPGRRSIRIWHLEDAAVTAVVAELTRLYLADIEDVESRQALEAASVERRVTEPLPASMLERSDVSEIVLNLLNLPFVEARRDGLVVHEAVRDAVAEFLRGTSPIRYRRYQRATWRQLRTEMRDATAADLWRYTADMLYLIDNPVVREAFFPSDVQQLAVEPAGHTVSRAELLREVWATDYTGGSNVVDAVVRTLRQKLGEAAFVLETIRGSGYRLRADWRPQMM